MLWSVNKSNNGKEITNTEQRTQRARKKKLE